jgi:hypothetical protein
MVTRALARHAPDLRSAPCERRSATRYRCLRETSCQPLAAGKDECVPALLEDLSTGGLRLAVRRCYEPGRVLAISWRPAPEGPKRTLLAHVIYSVAEGSGNWILGCGLMNQLDALDLETLLL